VKICGNLPTIDNLKPIGKHNTTPKRKLTNIFKFPSPISILNSKNIKKQLKKT
jgi:hypothetical protein